MKILLTGAFGNVGLSTLKELIKKDYKVRVFEVNNKKNRNIAKNFKDKIGIIWGDLRNKEDVNKAVQNQDIVISRLFLLSCIVYCWDLLTQMPARFSGTGQLLCRLCLFLPPRACRERHALRKRNDECFIHNLRWHIRAYREIAGFILFERHFF